MAYFDVPEGKEYATIDKAALKKVMEDSKEFENKKFFLIDVRTAAEVKMTGTIKHAGISAVNIPLSQLDKALSLTEEEFNETYRFSKPNKVNDVLVFSCLSGHRSDSGSKVAVKNGYVNVANYGGGAKDWFFCCVIS